MTKQWLRRGLFIVLSGSVAAAAQPGGRTPDQEESVVGPQYRDAAELNPGDRVPRGDVIPFVMQSSASKFYPGIAKDKPGTVPYERKVSVYVPKQLDRKKPAPLIVAQDGQNWAKNLVPVLDSMIAAKRLPPIAAVFINSGGGDGKGSERGLEYDTVSGKYADFVETEVLPRAAKEAGIHFTKDPAQRMTMGGSSGGAAAFTMAWFRPDLYGRVLTYSGTYVDQQSPPDPAMPHGAWAYHERLIAAADKKPIRIWLEVSENDNGSTKDEASLHNWVMANQRMAAALKAKGYDYRYVFAKDAKHVDGRVTRQTLPDALAWVWR